MESLDNLMCNGYPAMMDAGLTWLALNATYTPAKFVEHFLQACSA
jgi:hypothetical protein